MTDSVQLILASASPRRRELLKSMGVEFSVHQTNTDESRRENELAEDFVARLARDKAMAARTELAGQPAILAADTIVLQGDRVFGKPRDFEHAKSIWRALSGTQHQVMTAVCLMVEEKMQVRVSVTDVELGVINEAQMSQYWATGEPLDKAGAYAIQGFASAWVKLIHGSYSNVVGLPLREVNQLLTSVELNWL
ncbi:MAG: septum formation protein [Cryomorphaceae bacterium]|jgi:septum formation protein